jgi:hypothetical protein
MNALDSVVCLIRRLGGSRSLMGEAARGHRSGYFHLLDARAKPGRPVRGCPREVSIRHVIIVGVSSPRRRTIARPSPDTRGLSDVAAALLGIGSSSSHSSRLVALPTRTKEPDVQTSSQSPPAS